MAMKQYKFNIDSFKIRFYHALRYVVFKTSDIEHEILVCFNLFYLILQPEFMSGQCQDFVIVTPVRMFLLYVYFNDE